MLTRPSATEAGISGAPAAGRRAPRFLRALPRRWVRSNDGAAAVEFALIAPLLVFSLLATVDLGLGVGERMALEHVLRTGAHVALQDPGEAAVTAAMQTTGAPNFPIDDGVTVPAPGALAVSTNKFCACPDAPGTAVACMTICPGTVPTYSYYRMNAQAIYTGSFMPGLSLEFDRSIQVQLR